MTAEQILSQAIESTGVAEIIRSSSTENSVTVFYRVRRKNAWLPILEYTLSRATCWEAHVCQHYFMRGGKLVYGWNFVLQSSNVPIAVMEAAKLIQQAGQIVPQVARGPMDSFPLVGASPRRNAQINFDPRLPGPGKGGPSHKGAYEIKTGD